MRKEKWLGVGSEEPGQRLEITKLPSSNRLFTYQQDVNRVLSVEKGGAAANSSGAPEARKDSVGGGEKFKPNRTFKSKRKKGRPRLIGLTGGNQNSCQPGVDEDGVEIKRQISEKSIQGGRHR